MIFNFNSALYMYYLSYKKLFLILHYICIIYHIKVIFITISISIYIYLSTIKNNVYKRKICSIIIMYTRVMRRLR